MATQLRPDHAPKSIFPPAVQVLRDESSVDVRAFARHYVSTLLALEGVAMTAAALCEAG